MSQPTVTVMQEQRHDAQAPRPLRNAMATARCRARGVTLIELLVALAIAAVIVGLAAPAFSNFIAGVQSTSRTNDLVAALQTARSEAVRRGQTVTVRSTGGSLDFHTGWSVFTDANADGLQASPATPADGTVVLDAEAATGGTTIKRVLRSGAAPNFIYTDSGAADRAYVSFNGRGANGSSNAAFFRICNSAQTSVRGRIVQVSAVGKVSLDSTTATCP